MINRWRNPVWATLLVLLACGATEQRASAPVAGATDQTDQAAARPSALPAASDAATPPPAVGQMAHIPGATYRMGSDGGEPDERPVHDVHVEAFDLDRTEVTVAQYTRCVRAGGCLPAPTDVQFPGITAAEHHSYDGECNDDRPDRQDHPQNCVDWNMADAFCRWAGERLPTEEEWEYAACGGNCSQALGERGGAPTILGAERWPFTTRVATAPPGSFGLYDMANNVWEWTASAYCPYDKPSCGNARRVVRGGSWAMQDFFHVRLTARSPADPYSRNTNLGFRCARSASAS